MVENNSARGAAAQRTAFLLSDMVKNQLESQMYWKKDFNRRFVSKVFRQFAAALNISWTNNLY